MLFVFQLCCAVSVSRAEYLFPMRREVNPCSIGHNRTHNSKGCSWNVTGVDAADATHVLQGSGLEAWRVNCSTRTSASGRPQPNARQLSNALFAVSGLARLDGEENARNLSSVMVAWGELLLRELVDVHHSQVSDHDRHGAARVPAACNDHDDGEGCGQH